LTLERASLDMPWWWRARDETAGNQALVLEGGRRRHNRNSGLPDDELIFQRHGFLLEKWRSVYGCFDSRPDLYDHRQSGNCPAKVLLSINDKMAYRYNSIQDVNTMLIAEGDVVASVVAAAWYRDNVRYFDMRNKNSEVSDDELILQRHGFLLEKWRSVYGCFETRLEHNEHRQSGKCPVAECMWR
jgi:hypothetical protein